MARINKIEKHGLGFEAQQYRELGYSYADVAKQLRLNHSEIDELNNLSDMSVKRYFDNCSLVKVENQLEAGVDPVERLMVEYRCAIRDINEKTDDLYDKAMDILNDAEQSENVIIKLKAIKEARDTLKLLKENQEALIKYDSQKSQDIYNINLKKETNVKNLLLDVSDVLCDDCKEKVFKEITKLIGE